ncbi:MAG: homocysteine S-methyltransferase [Firmicutes bacterium]|nr:homocysteine S-methyltransferase [Bacillota bacterium]
MNLQECFRTQDTIMIEGALGVRLRGEYGVKSDPIVANASLVYEDKAAEAMKEIYGQYIEIAERYHFPILLMTPTRRANRYNVERSSYGKEIIRDNVNLLKELRDKHVKNRNDIYVGALMGCKGDAYKATEVLSEREAYEFHSWQAELFAAEQVDFLYAGIMPAMPEIIGMAQAMGATGIPYIISFMVRCNGRLIDGTTIHDAIQAVEETVGAKPMTYMANCLHPTNLGFALAQEFNQTELVRTRFTGIQANASQLTPEELDGSCEIITSDPVELAQRMIELRDEFKLKIYGGCCGTNQHHMEELAKRLSNLG